MKRFSLKDLSIPAVAFVLAASLPGCDNGNDVVQPQEVAVTAVTLSQTSLTLSVGESEILSATVAPSNATDKTVAWNSSNEAVAMVSSSGKVLAVAVGTATITAKASGRSATCTVTVVEKTVSVTSVTLNKTSLNLTEGDSETLIATVKPDDATDKTVTWSSSNTAVATVSNAGKVTAVKKGTATITAKAGDKTATCAVTVTSKDIGAGGIEGTGEEDMN